jgi:arginase
MKSIKIIEVKSELGAGTRGSSLGAEALKIASLEFQPDFFGNYPSTLIRDTSNLLFKTTKRSNAKRIEGIIKIFDKLSVAVYRSLFAKKFPVVISGDHSSAGGTIAGIKLAYPNEQIGVIWIDAHADIHTPYTTPSGNIHGMPLAAALGIDNLESQTNQVSGQTAKLWSYLKNLGEIKPKLTSRDLVYIGLRDLEAPEVAYINKHDVKVMKVEDFRNNNLEAKCREALEYLSQCTKIYITFDVDVLSAELVRGTGTRVPGGFTPEETTGILVELCKNDRICCLEVTEINPLLDVKNETARLIFPIFQKAVMQIEKTLGKSKDIVKKKKKKKSKLAP